MEGYGSHHAPDRGGVYNGMRQGPGGRIKGSRGSLERCVHRQ